MLDQELKDYIKSDLPKHYSTLDEIKKDKKTFQDCINWQVEKAHEIERDGVYLNKDYYFALIAEIEENRFIVDCLSEMENKITNAENN